MSANNRRNDALAVVGEPTLTVATNFVLGFARRHYITTMLYALGLVCVAFGTGLAVSPAAVEKYDRIMSEIDQRETIDLMRETAAARQLYYNAKGWFTCDATCTTLKNRLDVLETKLAQARKKNDMITSNAKAEVGVFSVYGVQEVRDTFWSTFAKGKEFAKNASWWDLMFLGIRSMGRDEGMAEFLIRWLLQVLMNLTLGLVGALVAFIWCIWGIISSYQPSIPVGIAAFLVFSVAGISMVATVLLSIYGVLACGAHAAIRSARIASIEGGRGAGPGAFNPQAQLRFGGPRRSPFQQQQQQQYQPSSSGGGAGGGDSFRVGSRVRLFGLQSEQYNGAIGTCFTPLEGQRWTVRLDDGREISVREGNIAPL